MQRLTGEWLEQRPSLNRRATNSSSSAKPTERILRSTAMRLSKAYALMGEKEFAIKQRSLQQCLCLAHGNPLDGPRHRRESALIQAMFGENSRAIPILARAVTDKRYASCFYGSTWPLRRLFLDSIRSGILCAAIPLSKNSARKSSREDYECTNCHEWADQLAKAFGVNWWELVKFVSSRFPSDKTLSYRPDGNRRPLH